jgi:catechol 2,3-dioxygenase-like lactoylglutathione lyase family enzyme
MVGSSHHKSGCDPAPASVRYNQPTDIPEARMARLILSALLLSLPLASPAFAQLATPNGAGVTMGHVHMNVADVALQKKLWIEHFGATSLSSGIDGVKLPGMLLLFRKQAPSGGTEGTVLDHFGLKVRSLPETLAKWRAAGYEVQREFTGAEGFPNAYLMGPDQVKIELQEDTALPTQSIAYHLHYLLADPLKLRDWYAETFTMIARKRGYHDTADVPGMNLTFQPSKTPPSLGTKGRTVDHIGFEIKNLEAFCKRLEARGVKFDVPYRQIPDRQIAVAFFTDPSGVYIELTEGLDKW